MKIQLLAFPFFVLSLVASVLASGDDKDGMQEQLDQTCEMARERKLAPLRQQYVDECVAKQHKDRPACERFYSDLGARSGNRAPLFYDLPECIEAFEYRKGHQVK